MIGRDIGCCWAADDRQHCSLQSQRMRFLDIQLEKRKILFTHLSKDEHGLYLLFRPRVLILSNILGLVVLVGVPHKRAGGDGGKGERRSCDVSIAFGGDFTVGVSEWTCRGEEPGWCALGRCWRESPEFVMVLVDIRWLPGR